MPDSSSVIKVEAPADGGKVSVAQAVGRCQGDGCRRKGGGMLVFVFSEKIADGIEREFRRRLCGPCTAKLVGVDEPRG